ncbi:hypothetical protein [Actinomadura sp. K4S16]|uniref:hypothetical protein n=1 Tax=Actinomadura sp. K4S16 TaxID=1316147 RepID=UPI0011ECA291|nr:hypothetical protein [Actinomadura sp. K4S16]
MPLQSPLFAGDARLEACLVQDSAHVTRGSSGSHVAKIQLALLMIDGLAIDPAEIDAEGYGAATAAAVLAFKTTRMILGPGQTTPDDIVGKRTVAALDGELVPKQSGLDGIPQDYCGNENTAVA